MLAAETFVAWKAFSLGRSHEYEDRFKHAISQEFSCRLKASIYACNFNILFSFMFLLGSFTARRSVIGMVCNFFYVVNAAIGAYGSAQLNRFLIAQYLLFDLLLNGIILTIVMVDYSRDEEVIMIYLYVPGIIIGLSVSSISIPLCISCCKAYRQSSDENTEEDRPGPDMSTSIPPNPTTQGSCEDLTWADGGTIEVSTIETASEYSRMNELARGSLCPISQEPMSDPVVAADGHTYERSSIEKWLAKNNTSPLTGLPLSHKNLTPNYTLRSMLQTITNL